MRHAVAGYKLGRDTEHRRAMFRNMAISLFTHGQITTTHHKAKAVQPLVEKLITLARKGDQASRRRAAAVIGNQILVDKPINWDDPPGRGDGYRVNRNREKLLHGPRVLSKLFNEIGPSFADRAGGYTRIIKLDRHRIGDGADLVVLQLLGQEEDDAPTMRGRYSRRRQKQDNRTAFAAKLRKAGKGETDAESQVTETEAAADSPAEDQVTADVEQAEVPAEPKAASHDESSQAASDAEEPKKED